MSPLPPFAPASRSARLAALAKAVVATVTAAWRARRNRRVVRDLLAFDDHLLGDIGLTRGDVAAALSTGGLADPSTRLRILAVERRAGARAQRREIAEALSAEEAALAHGLADRLADRLAGRRDRSVV